MTFREQKMADLSLPKGNINELNAQFAVLLITLFFSGTGRLCLSPEEIFGMKLQEKVTELADAEGNVGRAELKILLEYIRELVNYF
jgi:hypothetical protein